MYHVIEFRIPFRLDVEISPRERMERVRVRRGMRVCAEVVPYVVETERGPMEVADLHVDDGSTARCVPFEAFRFVD
jgi:hypothetical protein